MKQTPRQKIGHIVVLVLYLLFALFPIYWMFITGLKTDSEIYSPQPTVYPHNPTFENYVSIYEGRPYTQYTINSIVISVGTTLVCIAFGTIAAYGFSRFRFPGNRTLRYTLLVSRIFPPISLIVPFFLIIGALRLYDTKLAQIIINTYMWLPFFIWINIGFFDSIPRELDESARIDGATRFQSFFRISLPLAVPGIGAASIIAFLETWKEFIYNLVLAPTPNAKNLSVGASDFIADMFISWGEMGAGAMIAAIPAFVFVIFFQRYIVQGLSSGAVKG